MYGSASLCGITAGMTIRISSSVTGAQVYVDNELQGETPYRAPLDPGRHTIRVTADGYDPFVREVQIEPDQSTELVASLSPPSSHGIPTRDR